MYESPLKGNKFNKLTLKINTNLCCADQLSSFGFVFNCTPDIGRHRTLGIPENILYQECKLPDLLFF